MSSFKDKLKDAGKKAKEGMIGAGKKAKEGMKKGVNKLSKKEAKEGAEEATEA